MVVIHAMGRFRAARVTRLGPKRAQLIHPAANPDQLPHRPTRRRRALRARGDRAGRRSHGRSKGTLRALAPRPPRCRAREAVMARESAYSPAAGRYRHDRLGVEVERTAMPHMPWQLAGPDPDGSGVVFTHGRSATPAHSWVRSSSTPPHRSPGSGRRWRQRGATDFASTAPVPVSRALRRRSDLRMARRDYRRRRSDAGAGASRRARRAALSQLTSPTTAARGFAPRTAARVTFAAGRRASNCRVAVIGGLPLLGPGFAHPFRPADRFCGASSHALRVACGDPWRDRA